MLPLKLARLPMAGLVLVSLIVLPRALSGSPVVLSADRMDLGWLGSADVDIRLGVVESLLLLLVSGIGLVVAVYSARNLVGQAGLAQYAVLETVIVAALALTVTAALTGRELGQALPGDPDVVAGGVVGPALRAGGVHPVPRAYI
ncbi:hypothetical protein [Lapillicoccus sp.]|uniref:hypothetical protein n=1 Tax=Lapillicoccus sp. TaxID=1909287 RepID=UPI0032668F3C